MDAINWHSFFFLLFALLAVRFRAGRGAHEQHRADGVLSDAVAGRHGGLVLPGRGRFRRRDAD